MTRLNLIMASIDTVVVELLRHDKFTLPEIIDGLKAYTKAAEIAAEIAAQAEGTRH